MELIHTELVSTFKARFADIIDVPVGLLTVCYNGTERFDNMPLSEKPFEPYSRSDGKTMSDNLFLHIRIEDPIVTERVKEILAKGSLIIKNEDVKIRAAS